MPVVDKTPEPESVPVAAFSERDSLMEQRLELLGLRNEMTRHGFDTVGKLDVRLSQLNQRLKELE